MATNPSHLVCLFVVTSGQNGESLGCDEEQIVVFTYSLHDIANNKVVTLQHHYVRPASNDLSEMKLTDDCKTLTGICEDDIRNAQPLDHVLDDLDRFLRAKELHPEHGGRPFCFCTDGSLHLRQCLHPEALRKRINLPAHYYRYFDVRTCFQKCYSSGVERPCHSLADMINFFGLEPDQSVEYGTRQCQDLSRVVHRLINDGFQFTDPETIMEKLEPGICIPSEPVDDETIVKARGLPWQSSDQDIANFFRGLNISRGGVALCLSQQGRRNGEALVRFDSREQRSLALRRHKHHLGQRYIEVYRASGKDFVNIAGGSNREAQAFLTRHSVTEGGTQIIVRMRGLPYTCTAEQVLTFFKQGSPSVDVLDGEDGILFVHQADGRATGDAFVIFASDEDVSKALTKHKQSIGTRYIELFKSTTAEVLQVLNRNMDPRSDVRSCPGTEFALLAMPSFHGLLPALPPQLITTGKRRDCIRMRGLAYETSVNDIVTFLGDHSRQIVTQGVHLIYSAEGTPSGEAFIQMDSEKSAESTALTKNKKLMFVGGNRRYVDVIQCSGDEMAVVLQQGLPAPAPAPLSSVPQPSAPVHGAAAPAGVLPTGFWSLPPPTAPTTDLTLLLQQRNTIPLPSVPGGTQAVVPQLLAAPAVPYSSPSVFNVSGNQLTQQLYAGLTVNQPTAILGAIQQPQLVAVPHPSPAQLRPTAHAGSGNAVMTSSGGGAGALQPLIYWYPPGGQVSPAGNAYLMPTCATPTAATRGLAQVPDMLSC